MIWNVKYFRCIAQGKTNSPDGENSMYFNMPVNKTTCHCIGPVNSDSVDNQGPLGGEDLSRA